MIYLSYKVAFAPNMAYCVAKTHIRPIRRAMPKTVAEQEINQIERQVVAFPDGVGISELEAALAAEGIVINRRSLLRRLNRLIESGRINARGALKGRIYRPLEAMSAKAAGTEAPIPLSTDGNLIRRAVNQPIQSREPVGYRRDFLPLLSAV
jgi:hypothetical protein